MSREAPHEADVAKRRLMGRLEETLAAEVGADPGGWNAFAVRLDRHFPALYAQLAGLYGDRLDFFYHLEEIVEVAARSWLDRPARLRALDQSRETDPDWFQARTMVGAVCYVDLYAGTLQGLKQRIPDLVEMKVTYLHLMPLFDVPEGNSDGGYAVRSYRKVRADLGTMGELAELAQELREQGISLVLDFVCNHTSDDHDWAIEARAYPNDEDRNAYIMFPDRTMPDAYDATAREIFPDQRPGNFTWIEDVAGGGRWVWTTFHTFQWDLNYANPMVFRRMIGEMLFLANQGADILRLDAVPFMWKQLGTVSESLPEAHLVVRAFNTIARIAAPALLFKSEAIVHPAEVASYIGPNECQTSYNPLLMAMMWEAMATRSTRLLLRSMEHWFRTPEGTAWVNYVRSHDDIGWTFDDFDAWEVGIHGTDHRRFLNRFYTGRFEGSFSRGLPFQENPKTGDARFSGTAASLAGLDKALAEEGPVEVDLAIRRVLAMYGIAMSIGGIPLVYLGDEVATLNDHSFLEHPHRMEDSRWVHRVEHESGRWARRTDPCTPEGRMYGGMRQLIDLRRSLPAIDGQQTTFHDLRNERLFAFSRLSNAGDVLVVTSFTEQPTAMDGTVRYDMGWGSDLVDLLSGERFPAGEIPMPPYAQRWLQRA